MIQVQNVSKEFKDKKRGKVIAVQDATFTCNTGRIFGLLGLNGAGKTTMLRMICTIMQPSSGTITVSGFDAHDQSDEVRRRIGFLPADGGLYEWYTPREILRYFAQLCKYPQDKIEERLNRLIALMRIDEFADRYAKHLSSGMTQKVCVARAVVHDPPVVIFDEPTNSLDVLTSVSVHEFIRQCRDEGKCVVLSTHIMSEAQKLCDDIAILHEGKILALATLEELRNTTGLYELEDIFIKLVGAKEA